MPPVTAYDDDAAMSDEEKKALAELDGAAPVVSTETNAVEGADTNNAAAPAAAAPAAPAAPAPPQQQAEDDEFKEFLAKHQGKTPEELARLAFAQNKRANREGFSARQMQEQIDGLQQRARESLERRRQNIAQRREQFDQRLKDDPDAATKELHDRLLGAEEMQAEEEARATRQEAAVMLATTAIPHLRESFNEVQSFGREMNYTDAELNGIEDGRDLVTLTLASQFAKLVKSGIVDLAGNLLIQVPDTVQSTDPRLKPPATAVTTLSSAPARSPAAQKSSADQMADMLRMSDADFDKLDPALIDELLKAA